MASVDERLPKNPVLAAWARALNDRGHAAVIGDARWRHVFATDEWQRLGGGQEPAEHWYSTELLAHSRTHYSWVDATTLEAQFERVREEFRLLGPYILFDTPGGRDELREVIDPELRDLVDDLEPVEAPPVWVQAWREVSFAGTDIPSGGVYVRVREETGAFVGTIVLLKPEAGMAQLYDLAAAADLRHLERMSLVEQPDRRPAAVLMADLEQSSALARRLSTAQYFAFGRRLVRTADRCIIDHGGIVGRHAGDGIVAFFLAETAGSESAAVRGSIDAARALRDSLDEVAARSSLDRAGILMRFGLHWGTTLYVGRITTGGRTEVTALGEEVNETARIEACATGGRTLASKSLLERLTTQDAHALGIDRENIAYTMLAELDTATEKTRRDAPTVPVHEI